MRIERSEYGTNVWASARDTEEWASGAWKSGPGYWPCSFLSGRRLFAAFDVRGDLVDLSIDGGKGDQDCPSDEFDAFMEDAIGSAHPEPVQKGGSK